MNKELIEKIDSFIEAEAAGRLSTTLRVLEIMRDCKAALSQQAQPVESYNYVQDVPDHCDRVLWKGRYYSLIMLPETPSVPQDLHREQNWKDTEVIYVHLENGTEGYAEAESVSAIKTAREDYAELKADRDHLEKCFLTKNNPSEVIMSKELIDRIRITLTCVLQKAQLDYSVYKKQDEDQTEITESQLAAERIASATAAIVALDQIEASLLQQLVASVPQSGNGASSTGNPEADIIIKRLCSPDPDFNDRSAAVAFIWKLVSEHKGPDGFATWKDAAIAERAKQKPSSQDIEKWINEKEFTYCVDEKTRRWMIWSDDLRAWMAGHARVPVESIEPVLCECGDEYPAYSYGAGWIDAVGCCANCWCADEVVKSASQQEATNG